MIYVSSLDKVIFASTGAVGNGAKYSNQYLRSTNGAVPTNTVKINYNGVAKNQGYLTWKNPSGATCRNVMQVSTAETKYTYSYTNSERKVDNVTTTSYAAGTNRDDIVVFYRSISRFFVPTPSYIQSQLYLGYNDYINGASYSNGNSCRFTFGNGCITASATGNDIWKMYISINYTNNLKNIYTVTNNNTYSISFINIVSSSQQGILNTSQQWFSLYLYWNYSATRTTTYNRSYTVYTNTYTSTKATTYNYNSKSTSASNSGTKTA